MSSQPVSRTVSGIIPNSPGRDWPGSSGRGSGGVAASPEQGGGYGADGRGGHDQHGVPGDRVMQPDPGLVEHEEVLAELEIFQPGNAAEARPVFR